MKDEIFNVLLLKLNQGKSIFLKSDIDCTMGKASDLKVTINEKKVAELLVELEADGIIKCLGNDQYIILVDIYTMRNYVIRSNKLESGDVCEESYYSDLTIDDIVNSVWFLKTEDTEDTEQDGEANGSKEDDDDDDLDDYLDDLLDDEDLPEVEKIKIEYYDDLLSPDFDMKREIAAIKNKNSKIKQLIAKHEQFTPVKEKWTSVERFETLCMDRIETIVKMDCDWGRPEAIQEAAKQLLAVEETNQSVKIIDLHIRVLHEFIICSDQDYSLIKKDVWH